MVGAWGQRPHDNASKELLALSILNELQQQETWSQFLADRTEKERLSREETVFFSSLLQSGEYKAAVANLHTLSVVQKKLINKGGAEKKRVVYTYTPTENAALKVLAWLCYRYDGEMPGNLYSFRQSISAKNAIRRMIATPGISTMYAYKLDIKNYFNSIDPTLLLQELKPLLRDDTQLYDFFSGMLTGDTAQYEGQLVHEPRGVMAGTPTSAFLANVYLLPVDRYFEAQGVCYARYSDDIILFAPTAQELEAHKNHLLQALAERKLAVNPEKESTSLPHEAWTFLGITYQDGVIDLSENTKNKLKGKIRRKARALYRWKERKGAEPERAARAFLRAVNRKLYVESSDSRHFSWSRWFFPLVTVPDGLKEIDEYILQYARYVLFGRFSRANYRAGYDMLKACGFRPLVSEYYRQKG